MVVQTLLERDAALVALAPYDLEERRSSSFLHCYVLLPAEDAGALLIRRCMLQSVLYSMLWTADATSLYSD